MLDGSSRSVLVCFGTRPEVIKLAPVIDELERGGLVQVETLTTGQHREMLEQMLDVFEIAPDHDLRLMREDQDLWSLSGEAIAGIGRVLADRRPEVVIVQGDTTTSFCAAYAAFLAQIPVAHVEAGLRTHNHDLPFPEEVNRHLTSVVARWHFCPTEQAAWNLHREGISRDDIIVTGNTVVDALESIVRLGAPPALEKLPPKRRDWRLLVTLHRRETHGEPQRRLCAMLRRLAERGDVELVLPVHLSPVVRTTVEEELEGVPGVHLIPPQQYVPFVHLMRSSDLILTDSGGVQEEAPSLQVPVVVMRDVTDRPEGVRNGCVRLSGTDPDAVERDVLSLLEDSELRERMRRAPNPYGDGRAAQRIAARLEGDLVGRQASPVAEWQPRSARRP
jgi:UDP-N-acetylglucosamine 2-epimerase (non-hydrolysing)